MANTTAGKSKKVHVRFSQLDWNRLKLASSLSDKPISEIVRQGAALVVERILDGEQGGRDDSR